jgi:aminodeoxyfutalosine synthase
MTTTSTFDQYMDGIAGGGQLTADDVRDLARTPDVLQLGMLADVLRRRIHGTRTTYVRVASCPIEKSFAAAVPPAAREVRITGSPDSLAVAVSAVTSARAVAGVRAVSGFSWADVERLAADKSGRIGSVLQELRAAGLDRLAELPLDGIDASVALERLRAAGFDRITVTMHKAPAAARVDLLIEAARLQERFACLQAVNPLPLTLNAFRPTTGYEDVKMVAVARLAAPNIPSVQVDWLRYGPKLAQVALTFGADDLYGVSASDHAPEGRRRAPLEEVRRNIEAAGFEPVERDGAFVPVA